VCITLWLSGLYRLAISVPRLRAMHDFYHHLLDIPDRDIQTVQWQHIVSRIMALRDFNLTTASNLSPEVRKLLDSKSRQRLDAVDIASRLMRRDNYLIALFNKEILDVRIPFLGNRSIFSETTKWHVDLAIMDFVFSGPNGQFNTDFLKDRNRRDLVAKLKQRFFWTAILSLFCAPFVIFFVLISYLFKYFTVSRSTLQLMSSNKFSNTTKTRPSLVKATLLRLHNGNSANSMNFLICSIVAETWRTHSQTTILPSFQRIKRSKYRPS
jgi:autophagy-related protein 9